MPNVKIRISKDETEKTESSGLFPSVGREKIAAVSIFAHQAINTGKQIVNYNINNVGVKAGNYVLQEQINDTIEIISDAASIGIGFAAGGPIVGAIASVGVATKQIFKQISRNEEIKHQNIESEYLARRSGNTTMSGSRGTEN